MLLVQVLLDTAPFSSPMMPPLSSMVYLSLFPRKHPSPVADLRRTVLSGHHRAMTISHPSKGGPRQSPWGLPPERLEPRADEVHLWRATLEASAGRVHDLRLILADDERERADRMESGRRRRFTVARGLLRMILARYREVEPDTLRFTYGEEGKPALAEVAGSSTLQFSVAHSGDLALYAVSPYRRVGVDVERIRADFGGERIAKRFFSAAEITALLNTPEDARSRAFFNCWTRKEAFIKATGNSILRALKSFDVSLAPGEPAALLRTHDDPTEAERWCLRDLDVGAGYAAALAVEGHECRLSYWLWST